MTSMFVPAPVISLAVKPKNSNMFANFSKALQRFSKVPLALTAHESCLVYSLTLLCVSSIFARSPSRAPHPGPPLVSDVCLVRCGIWCV